MKSLSSAVAQIDQFSNLSEAAIERLDAAVTWHDYDQGHFIIDAAACKPHGVYLLISGTADVLHADPNQGLVQLSELNAVTCFGEYSAIDGHPCAVSVRTTTPCTVAEIPAETFRAVLADSPALSLYLLRKAVGTIRGMTSELVSCRDAEHKIDEAYHKSMLWTL